MTNDESYKDTKINCEYSKFGLDEKKGKGLLYWGDKEDINLGKKKKITKEGKIYYERPNFELSHSYVGKWEPIPNSNTSYKEKFYVYTVVVDNKNFSQNPQSRQP